MLILSGFTLTLSLLNPVLKTINSVREDTAHTRNILNKAEDIELLKWLSSEHYGAQQSDTLRRWHPRTGKWFLESEQYNNWLQTRARTLYCPGIPGAGKTIISSAVIHDLTRRYSAEPSIAVAHIYFTFARQQEQTVEHVLASLLVQILRRQTTIPDDIRGMYGRHIIDGTRPTHGELIIALQSVAIRSERVFIVFDALDECTTEDQCRGKILTEALGLQAKFGVNILATSRVHNDIASRFNHLGTSTFTIMAHQEDMEIVLRGRMKAHDPEIFDHIFSGVVAMGIISATEGM